MANHSSTIAALATAPAPAGIAVVRVSGASTKTVIKALFKANRSPVEDPRRLCFGHLVDHKTGGLIDKALAVYMPGPHSYTGEDVGEFHFHGSPLLVQKFLRSLFAFGVSPAEPGEFTKRAFINGKIDLVQAEAIADLINATSDEALRVASEQLKGSLSRAIGEVGEPLRNVLAELEAGIDFPEEGIAPAKIAAVTEQLKGVAARIEQLQKSYSFGQVVKEGFKVLLCGPPNAGKSSILNFLLGRERAIVSPVPGTTRDLIEEVASIGRHRFVFCDSAGFTETTDIVEQKGIELARSRIDWADLILFVVDASVESNSWDFALQSVRPHAKAIWMIINKIDLNPGAIGTVVCDSKVCSQNHYISAKTHDGMDTLLQSLAEEVEQRAVHTGDSSGVLTSERHFSCLTRALDATQLAIEAAERGLPLEILSSEVRNALTALQEIIGKTFTEDILGRIFSRFCIGK